MVTTRRSSARLALTTEVGPKCSGGRNNSKQDTITVVASVEGTCGSSSYPLDPPQATLQARLADSSSELDDLNNLPPSTGNTPEKPTVRVLRTSRLKNKQGLRRQAQVSGRATAVHAGSAAHNPIDLDLLEDSPQLENTHASKQGLPEPHRFVERHRQLYRQTQARPHIQPRPDTGSTFTGDPHRDILRMRLPANTPHDRYYDDRHRAQHDVASERQHPSRAQHQAQQPGHTESPQLARSDCGAQDMGLPIRQKDSSYSTGVAKKRKVDEANALNTSSQLSQLTEYTAILSSLIQAYPVATNQEELRAEITMLASVQNRCLQDWARSESQGQRRRISDSAIDLSSESEMTPSPEEVRRQEAELKKMKEQDDAVRAYFSSHAEIWQDGSGLSVADVFGDPCSPCDGIPDSDSQGDEVRDWLLEME